MKLISNSKYTLIFIYGILLIVHFCYYPKWSKTQTEATLSWDVSGYYMYLPAVFIYQDVKKLDFKDTILEKYRPTPQLQQAFLHESGNYVFKYSMGQAVQFLPFFALAHTWAKLSPAYEADGFSFPYQFMISLGSLIIAFLGLFFLGKYCLFTSVKKR